MKKNPVYCLVLFIQLSVAFFAQGQSLSLEWAHQIGGINYDVSSEIKVDEFGNVYTTGVFSNTADFDPGPEVLALESLGDFDVFIQKVNASGELVWVNTLGGEYGDGSQSIAFDGLGNIYSVGGFNPGAIINHTAGISQLNSNGESDIFIQKLDSMGNLLWVKTIGGVGWDRGFAISIDNLGNIITSGSFEETVDFDPGPGIFNLTAEGDSDFFIQKLTPEGELDWVKHISGSGFCYANTIKIDSSGDLYFHGRFTSTFDFDPGSSTFNLTSTDYDDAFILKLNSFGDFIWVKQNGGRGPFYGKSLVLDEWDNIYTIGSFSETVDFDPSSAILNLTSNGESDIYIQKINSSGELIWVKQIGGQGNDSGRALGIDDSGKIYATGLFSQTVDFAPGIETFNLTSTAFGDTYILMLDGMGEFVGANKINSQEYCVGLGITVDNSDNVYLVGVFTSGMNFESLGSSIEFTTNPAEDIFIAKLSSTITSTNAIQSNNDALVYPNPTTDLLNIENQKSVTLNIQLLDATGKVILNKESTNQNITVNMNPYSKGVYFLVLSGAEGIINKKVIKQ